MKNLSPLGPIGEINNIDYIHLSSVSCINIIGFKPLSEYINKRNFVWNHDEFFNTKIGKEVKNAWEIVGGGRLTSVGILIGLYVYEELSGEKVDINDIWSLNP